MKKLVFLIFLFYTVDVLAQEIDSLEVDISGQTCIVIPKRTNLESIPKHIFGLAFKDIVINKKTANWGLVQPMHYYFADNNWYGVYNNFMITPFGEHESGTTSLKYKFYRIEAESTSSFFFNTKSKMKSSLMNIRDQNGSIHLLNIDWPSTVRIAVRTGVKYQQFAMNEEISTEIFEYGAQNIRRSVTLRGIQQAVVVFGISRQQIKGLKCNFCQLGDWSSFNIREWYIDGLFSPIQQVYGNVRDTIIETGTQHFFEEKKILNADYKFYKLGARVGYKRIGTWARIPKVIISAGGEVGFYTGPAVYNFEFSIKLGVYFGIERKMFDKLN